MKEVLQFKHPNILVGLPTAYRSFETTERKHIIFWRSQIAWTYPRFKTLFEYPKRVF